MLRRLPLIFLLGFAAPALGQTAPSRTLGQTAPTSAPSLLQQLGDEVRQLELRLQPSVVLAAGQIAVIWDTQGHIVIPVSFEGPLAAATQVPIRWPDGREQNAKVVGTDRPTHLTVLQVSADNLQPVQPADAEPSDWQWAVLADADGVTHVGPFSLLRRQTGLLILPDATAAGFVRQGRLINLKRIAPVVKQLIDSGTVHRAALGLVVHEETLGHFGGGVVVDRLLPDGAAEKCGFQPGDRILGTTEQRIDGTMDLALLLARQPENLTLRVARPGSDAVIIIKLTPAP